MKNYKKVLLASTMIAATLSITACSKDEPAPETTAPATETPATTETTPAATGDVTGRTLFQNVNARKAFALGFNKQYIVDTILNNGSTSADYFIPRNFILAPDGGDWRDSTTTYMSYDVAAAQEHWAKAKEELGFETIEVEFLNFDTEAAKTMAEFIKSELEQNLEGLTLTIKPIPFQQKLEELRAGNFDMSLAGWGPDYLDATTFLDMWLSDSAYNDGKYNSPTYDALVRNDETDEAARYANHTEAERLLLEEDAAIASIYQRARVGLNKPELTGIVSHTFGPDYTFEWVELDREDKMLHLIETSKAPTLDANMVTDAVSFGVMNAINENLISLGKEGSDVIPGIAESWDISEDGLTYTFHLREGATFVDYTGAYVADITAQSFVDSWTRLEDPATAANYAYMVRDVAHMDTFTAIDDYTLEVKLTQETPWFLSLLAFGTFGPIDQATVDKFGTTYGTTLETTISSGPFYLSQWNFSERMVVTKNPTYWNAENVKIDGIDWRVIEGVDQETSLAMYFNNEIDRVALSGENVETYKDHDDVYAFGDPTMWYLIFNQAGQN